MPEDSFDERLSAPPDLSFVKQAFKSYWRRVQIGGVVQAAGELANTIAKSSDVDKVSSLTRSELIAWWLCAAVRETDGPLTSVEAAWYIGRKVFEREIGGVATGGGVVPKHPPIKVARQSFLVCPNCNQGRLIEDLYTYGHQGATCDQCRRHFTAEQLDEWSV